MDDPFDWQCSADDDHEDTMDFEEMEFAEMMAGASYHHQSTVEKITSIARVT